MIAAIASQATPKTLLIVSGATAFVVRPIADRLGIEHILYTRLEVENGLFTGRVIEPICFEEGKIYWLQQFIEEEQIDLARSYFYTDSVTDRPLLVPAENVSPCRRRPFTVMSTPCQ